MTDSPTGTLAAPQIAAGLPSRWNIIARLAPIVVVLALISALVTFVVLAGYSPITPTSTVVLLLFLANFVLIVVLLALTAAQGLKLYAARRAGAAGARLHFRIVMLCTISAAVPAVIIAVVASITLERGLNPAFFQDVRGFILRTAGAVQSYRGAQCETLLREAALTAADLDSGRPLFTSNRALFNDYFSTRVRLLGFVSAALVKPNGDIVERVDSPSPLRFILPEANDFADAQRRRSVCLELEQGRTFVALRALPSFDDTFLYVARRTNSSSAGDLADSAANLVALYNVFQDQRRNIEVAFATMYVLVALIMLLSAVWLGLSFANRLVAPIQRLVHATDQVSSGNLYVQVPINRSDGDLANLGRTFNKMTSELRLQQNRLIAANALIDERRMFTEAVLSGVPAAVIGVDAADRISVLNPSARGLLDIQDADALGAPVGTVIPELASMIAEANVGGRSKFTPGQLTLTRNGRQRTFNVRLTAAAAAKSKQGYVVTLDDITDLVSAQRTAAWADVARRIAHEIKNPLTPIQLSAERLKRRFGRLITEGRDVFDQCTDTIVRQVDDIKRMVDEFSAFARMPKAMLERDDLGECIRQVLFLLRVAHPDIAFEDDLPAEPVQVRFDLRLMSRALTNVVKNATEGILARPEPERGQGRVTVSLSRTQEGAIVIEVTDNGVGLPKENRQRLLEPYVTTRSEGTGLGLAIVAKILEDHGGTLELLDAPPESGSGARIRLAFPDDDGGGVNRAALEAPAVAPHPETSAA